MSRETYEDSVGKNLEGGIATSDQAKVGSAGFLIELENRRSIKVCESLSYFVHIFQQSSFLYPIPTSFKIPRSKWHLSNVYIFIFAIFIYLLVVLDFWSYLEP